jgi:hypothetical protein
LMKVLFGGDAFIRLFLREESPILRASQCSSPSRLRFRPGS